jgi:hypothetical protein
MIRKANKKFLKKFRLNIEEKLISAFKLTLPMGGVCGP